jgi:hypothetical protein
LMTFQLNIIGFSNSFGNKLVGTFTNSIFWTDTRWTCWLKRIENGTSRTFLQK